MVTSLQWPRWLLWSDINTFMVNCCVKLRLFSADWKLTINFMWNTRFVLITITVGYLAFCFLRKWKLNHLKHSRMSSTCSLQNRRDFLRIYLACDSRFALASRSPRFCLCSPKYAKNPACSAGYLLVISYGWTIHSAVPLTSLVFVYNS